MDFNIDMKKLKEEYENVKCSDDLKERVETTMKTTMETRMKKGPARIRYALSGIAAAFVICTITLNAMPSAARAAMGVPFIEKIVNVLTFGRFEMNENGYEAKIITPEIEGLSNKELENKLNKEFRENAAAIKEQYLKDVEEMKKEFGDETIHMGLEMNYKVLTDTPDILALDIYIFNAAGSSSTRHSYYNINKKTNKLITLSSLYKNDKAYREKLSEYIVSEMKRQNKEEGAMFWLPDDEFGGEDTKKALADNKKFYINDKNEVVICFDKYEIAAGAQGSPEFAIPESVIKPML